MTQPREAVVASAVMLVPRLVPILECSIYDAPNDLGKFRLTQGSYTPTQIWNDREVWATQEEAAHALWASFTPEYKETLVECAESDLVHFLKTVDLTPELDISDLVVKSGNFLKVEVRLTEEYAFYFMLMFTDADKAIRDITKDERERILFELGIQV
jgi:hypothetical protein